MPASRESADQPPRLRPDVGTPVAPDLGLVAHPAQRDADELAAECIGHRLAEGGLADPGRAHQSEDRPRAAAVHRSEAALSLQFANGQVLEDAVLHILQPVVVCVEDGGRLRDVVAVLRLDAPRHLEHGVEPGTDPSRLGTLLARALELVDLALDRGPHVLRQVTLGQLGPIVVRVVVSALPAQLAQLLADGLELATEKELTLRLLHPLLDVGLDPLAQGEVGEGVPGPAQDEPEALLDVERLEDLDLLGQRQVG